MIRRITLISIIGIISLLLVLEGSAYYISIDRPLTPPSSKASDLNKLMVKNRVLKDKIARLSPEGTYIVVDTAHNLLFLKKGDKTILKAIISSGSGSILKDPNGERRWVFDTPRGEFEVKRKIRGPTWIKPDWAFIEDGEEVPRNLKDRTEEGVLGDYALAFGDGYFIHGTLYKRLLGRNVTHGCIRVEDKDLKAVYKLSRVGTRIFIF